MLSPVSALTFPVGPWGLGCAVPCTRMLWRLELHPDAHLELPPASLEQCRDGENSAASSPDRNLLVLSFTPAHNVIPQRPLAEERLEEQGLNFRGFLQLAGKKS